MSLLKYAKRYAELGFAPIPIESGGKRPLIAWKQYQVDYPTLADLEQWFPIGEDRNIGLVLGRGIFALDLDGPGSRDLIKQAGILLNVNTPCAETGKGFHFLFRALEAIPDCVGLLKGDDCQVDIRGIGYIVAPPSIHANGKKYRWIIDPTKEIPQAPTALLDLIRNSKAVRTFSDGDNDPGWVGRSLVGVDAGLRNETCARLAGYFLGKKIDKETVKKVLAPFALGCKPPMDLAEMFETVESIDRKNGNQGIDRSIVPRRFADILAELFDSLFITPETPVATGFSRLDDFLCGGFRKGELIYLGARPGVGKTALAMQTCVSSAEIGTKCLIISREMSSLSLARRMLAQKGKINSSDLRRKTGLESKRDEILKVCGIMNHLPLWINDVVMSIEEICACLDSLGPGGVDFLVVDHLQLIRGGHKQDRRLQIEEVSRGLKGIAIDYKIPVLCMSTLSRPKFGKDQKPGLDSLRESGELEHDADIVLLLHREIGSDEAECTVAKNREGLVGKAYLRFEGQYLSFALDQERAEQVRAKKEEKKKEVAAAVQEAWYDK